MEYSASALPQPEASVLVVGAGPVGLALARCDLHDADATR
jgi:threonine dehydrogenase-like Zn-dependent dehydrogenase